ncbi:hypothetical protein HUW62_03900 [Myxococcus sp. AM011]|uniref:ORC-CDC6 family AAA ATPase n=1 Tax=Myxococcus sp. AM011 TaxID=2745200 RepID=UPI001595412F|nr:hypothetical protein [Myxococcus sp. AM011]NVJ20364.1 hypothetical protein [Myxococcus sp. AM011]
MSTPNDILLDLFGDYRAEWRSNLFGSLFIQPPYFSELESIRPCVLFGGRGTGKTTALRSLRFDAAYERMVRTGTHGKIPYLGIYVRINKNRVNGFKDSHQPPDVWSKVFAHYINLLIALEFARLIEWLETGEQWIAFTSEELSETSRSLGLAAPKNIKTLKQLISQAIIDLEMFINNPHRTDIPLLSMAEAPIRHFATAIASRPECDHRNIFCCIDEYENLSPDQQAIVNTYIKHSEPPLSYKIGVRRNGLKTRQTIDQHDLLRAPDDYNEIDISAELARHFAIEVVEQRLRLAAQKDATIPTSMAELLPELSRKEEAKRLGAGAIAASVVSELEHQNPSLGKWARNLGVDAYFIRYCAEMDDETAIDVAHKWINDPTYGENRLNNYGYSSLFWLSKGRKGARIRKYYCGSDTFITLASGNIRYLLHLIDESVSTHFASAGTKAAKRVTLDPINQTEAAKAVGKKRLDQLEGLTEKGIELKRLVLAIGKVFFEYARSPIGHAPEIASFVLTGTPDARASMSQLLNDGVAHLAFEVSPRTKATTESEMKDDEYRLHPIFSPFFEFSHRRKRRATFSADTLLSIQTKPQWAIQQLMAGRSQVAPDELPEQLALFEQFFSGGHNEI